MADKDRPSWASLILALQLILVELTGAVVAEGLNRLYHDDLNDNGGNHHVHLETLVTVTDG